MFIDLEKAIFMIVWSCNVKEMYRQHFEKAYASDGEWIDLGFETWTEEEALIGKFTWL